MSNWFVIVHLWKTSSEMYPFRFLFVCAPQAHTHALLYFPLPAPCYLPLPLQYILQLFDLRHIMKGKVKLTRSPRTSRHFI